MRNQTSGLEVGRPSKKVLDILEEMVYKDIDGCFVVHRKTGDWHKRSEARRACTQVFPDS